MALTALLSAADPVAAESLGDILREHGVTAGQGMSLDTPITSYSVLADAKRFVVAYYKNHSGNALVASLHISRLERASGRWTHAALDERSVRKAAPGCLGSVLSVQPAGEALLVETHINRSASCTFVLSRDLEIDDVVFGWPLAVFGDGLVVYEHSQPHFFAVHPLEVSLYDPRTRKSVSLYPPVPPQPLRAAYVDKVRVAYTEAWCRAQNHPCEAERFDERLEGPVAINEKARGLVFMVTFDDRALPGMTDGAVYVYRNIGDRGPPQVKELAPDDLTTRCGDVLSRAASIPGRWPDSLRAEARGRILR
jgi:hypothetical protein